MQNPPPSSFTRNLLGNLRLSIIVCAAIIALLVLYSVVAGTPILWNVVLFLGIGMLASSLINALLDARRKRNQQP